MQRKRTDRRPLRRIAPGIYETQDGRSRIIRTAGLYEGPQGGQRDMWEIAHGERDAWVPDGRAYRTLKEARRHIGPRPRPAGERRALIRTAALQNSGRPEHDRHEPACYRGGIR